VTGTRTTTRRTASAKAALILGALIACVAVAVLLVRDHRALPGSAVPSPDGCVACHGSVTGLDGPHAPAAIGCAACHGGDASARDKAAAHTRMLPVPGNLADAARSCGRTGCHETIIPRVENSIMATMAGVIAVDRAVLGEPVPGDAPLPHAARLGHGVADSHLRELCVGCHLGQAKTEWGPISQQSQGGGCNACHLEYGAAAAAELERYTAVPREARSTPPTAHPTLTVNPRNEHCFGCHSRSGRIVLSYEGWHEMRMPPSAKDQAAGGRTAPRFRQLDDKRWVERVIPDIHHERGMECIDCHTSIEVMGAGVAVASKRGQLRVGCEDCHARTHASVSAESLDPESTKLLALRRWTLGPTQRMGTTRDGAPLVNVVVDEGGGARLLRKRTGEALALKPPVAACIEGSAHSRLSCASCHAAWAPRCTSCHTAFDPADEGFDHAAQAWVKGTWNETAGPFEAMLPTLGVAFDGTARGAVDTFVPGMVMSFDRNMVPGGSPDVIFRRLYAKLFAHTIRRESRSCRSCHNDPVALGFGKGELRYVVAGSTGRWTFRPAAKPSPFDGLPEDAWTGFLQTRTGMVSTREGARPFTADEQRRILRVGACLSCHAGDSPVMKRALADFDAVLARRSPRCALPPAR
jgi:hypothetical protein